MRSARSVDDSFAGERGSPQPFAAFRVERRAREVLDLAAQSGMAGGVTAAVGGFSGIRRAAGGRRWYVRRVQVGNRAVDRGRDSARAGVVVWRRQERAAPGGGSVRADIGDGLCVG